MNELGWTQGEKPCASARCAPLPTPDSSPMEPARGVSPHRLQRNESKSELAEFLEAHAQARLRERAREAR